MTERDRQTDRQRERQRERQSERERENQRESQSGRERGEGLLTHFARSKDFSMSLSQDSGEEPWRGGNGQERGHYELAKVAC